MRPPGRQVCEVMPVEEIDRESRPEPTPASAQQEARNRRQIKRIEALPPPGRYRQGLRLLEAWKAEARRRADRLDEPSVWALRDSKVKVIAACDPSGELASELSRICHEALAGVVGLHLMGGSRPLADRSRLQVRSRSAGAESRSRTNRNVIA